MTQILAGETLLIPSLHKIIKGNLLVQQAIVMARLISILQDTLQKPHAKEWVLLIDNKTSLTLS
jgi:hypothetical protein